MRMSEVRPEPRDTKGSRARMQRQGYCQEGCAACCTYIRLEVHPAYKDEDISRWIELHGVRLKEVGQRLYAYIPTPCSALHEGRCSIYEDRPNVCRSWPTSQADITDLEEYVGKKTCTYSFTLEE